MKNIPKVMILLLIFRLFSLTTLAQDEVTSYIQENPDSVAVICLQGDETIVSHNADEHLTIASTSKIIILAEYARQVAAGNLDPEEEVSLEEVARYLIPMTDGNAHEQWLATLDAGAETATLAQIVDGMIIFSSNAGADYIHSRLSTEGFEELYELLELENTDLPTYFLGNLLVLSNHETGLVDLDYVEAMDEETFFTEHDRLLDLFLNDADWLAAERDFRDDERVGLPSIEVQASFLNKFSTASTAEDILKVIQEAYTGTALSAEAHEVMQDHFDWIFDVNPANADVFEALATKGGAYPGLLTAAWYVDAIAADPLSLVVFYHDIPEDTWLEWLTSYNYQSLELAAITTPAGCSAFGDVLP